jgi:D-sedoheptulose 7-phosphate isomerase
VNDRDLVTAAFRETAALHQQLGTALADGIVRAARVIGEALARGGKVLAFGNGGSAADAQHLAAELVSRFMRERRAVAALALTADTAVLTAVGNDYDYDAIFARQIEALGRAGDVAVGLTTSGASRNVNLALARARAQGLTTIGLTGRDGGETARLVEVHLNVPSASSARVQEVQRTMLHVMCQLVERDL